MVIPKIIYEIVVQTTHIFIVLIFMSILLFLYKIMVIAKIIYEIVVQTTQLMKSAVCYVA